MFVDNGSTVNIIYIDAYKRIGVPKSEFSPMTTGDHVISKGTIKLVVTMGEHPRVSTVMIEFLVVDSQLAFNGVIGRSFLKALKAVTSIYHFR